MLPLSSLAWSLLAKGASALGLAAVLMVETVTGMAVEDASGSETPASITRDLRLIPEVLLGSTTGPVADFLLPSLYQSELQPMPSLGLRRFHNILEVGLTFGGTEAIELQDEDICDSIWIQGMDPADTAEIESLTVRLSWEI